MKLIGICKFIDGEESEASFERIKEGRLMYFVNGQEYSHKEFTETFEIISQEVKN